MLLFTLFACETEEPVYDDFFSEVSTLEELVEVPEVEVEDTAIEEEINNVIQFKTEGISCTDLGSRTLTFTEMFPGRAEINSIDAEFYAEAFRYSMSALELETPLDNNGIPEDNNCLVSMTLPDVAEEAGDSGIEIDFKDITLFGEGEEVFGVQWAFLYPAMYAKKETSCGLADEPQTGNMISCEYTTSAGTTGIPGRETLDPQLGENDYYEWGSDVLLVYVKGLVAGSFSDLGYQAGWNLVQLDQSALSLVEPINELQELQEITIDTANFTPRDNIDIVGSTEDTSWPGMFFSIGLAPFHWFEYGADAAVEAGYEFVRPEVNNSWIMDIYNVPESAHFLTADDAVGTYQVYYEQWSEHESQHHYMRFQSQNEW